MTRHNKLRDFIDLAFSRSIPLCRARFGELVADVWTDERAAEQGYRLALIPTGDNANVRFAILTGDYKEFAGMVPEKSHEAHLSSDGEYYAYWKPGAERQITVFDRERKRGAIWYPEPIPPGALGQPCEPLVQAAIEPTGWVVAHCAAVGRNDRFLLLLGPGKSGKSTAALACARAGWQYAGDDLVLLNPSTGSVAPMFSSARVRQSGASEFRSLVDAAFMVSDEDGQPRYELRLQGQPTGGKVVALAGVRRRGSPQVTFVPGRPIDYLGALLRDSTSRALGCSASMTPKLLAVAGMAPAFLLDTGTDPAQIPAGLGRMLESIR
jgi:hypothetical protein